ncbi:alanine/glycine:cation symporter family protein [Guptibacillus hwajinpoensis]|uniref:AGCS family alanine or glycine:cation symporter n=2 Tax=Guptibacillus hwajinpoensis TaxID=208199 RepID=A0ABU0K6C5_9BACL|nr:MULTISPECIES: alanine/glycine:cation symporter family protein [Alkalihalobacillus]KMM35836.1 sodium:alanine symporter [Alkalihalobacillus macyae]MDP4552196.1 alanine/glycine:cation symporter family protein [Alkalihalobacillus macyae]MDQ0484921.1 AGCS family alanine or glycine:cation symporter [Alkalihalobacillus hemicentroti]
MDILEKIVSFGNDLIWSNVLIFILIGVGLYFTIRSRFVQFRLFGEMVHVLTEKDTVKGRKKSVSSLQAFFISTASRVGTGNLAGVASAVSIGGPGAVFWMWVIALLGAASGFVESTLAQIYKVRDGDDFRGGPAYYMQRALNARWLGIIFAVLITFSFGLVFNSVQSNTIALAFENSFDVNRWVLGAILTVATAIIIFGGVRRIAVVSQIIVPIMAGIYLLVAAYVLIVNFTEIPAMFALIFQHAFGLKEVTGGGVGAAMLLGIKRGLFSNEAGMGSAPNAAATADVSHPVKQGLIQALGVFVDTLLIATATAFMVMMSNGYVDSKLDGVQLTQEAMNQHLGSGAGIFVAVAVLLFAFSSIIGNYYYGETNIEFIKSSKTALLIYRLAVLGMVMFGAKAGFGIVWGMADLSMGLMALLNLIVIAIIGKVAFVALKDYRDQRKAGKDPQFYADTIKGLKSDIWTDRPVKDKSN